MQKMIAMQDFKVHICEVFSPVKLYKVPGILKSIIDHNLFTNHNNN